MWHTIAFSSEGVWKKCCVVFRLLAIFAFGVSGEYPCQIFMCQALIMRATLFGALNVFLCFSLTLGRLEDLSTQNAGTIEQKRPKCTFEMPFLQFYRISSTLTYRDRVLRAVSKWEHHGMTLLAVPEHFIMLDLTVHMDIHPQPGPELTSEDSGKRDTMLRKNCRSRSGRSSLFKTIERETLLSLRRYAYMCFCHRRSQGTGYLKIQRPTRRKEG